MTLTPICSVDATGIHRPTLADCLTYFYNAYRSIYGQDAYLEPDSQDGQFLALIASALDDANAETVAAYNAFSPTTAQGVGLSSVVKINGIARKIPSFSTVDITILGQVGTIIENGILQDRLGQFWLLPPEVIIPASGTIEVTATAEQPGAISADINTIDNIYSVTAGWQSATNLTAAALGAPVESDGELRIRQAFSASLPALSTNHALLAAIADIPGVSRYHLYHNDEAYVDAYGVPGHSIALVISGGDIQIVADTLQLKKGQGVSTYGKFRMLTSPDDFGIQRKIYFSPMQTTDITFKLKIIPLVGFTMDIAKSIKKALIDWINGMEIGQPVLLADAYLPARLYGAVNSKTFKIVPDSILIARDGNDPMAEDIDIKFDETAISAIENVTLTLVK